MRITPVASSGNALYLAVAAYDYDEDSSHVQVRSTEAKKLEAEAECQDGNQQDASDGLTAYAKEHGLDSESYPGERFALNPVAGFSLSYSQSRFGLYVTRRSTARTNSTEVSSSVRSRTSKAIVDFCLDHDDEIWMIPYASGLEIRQNRAELPLGMIAARKWSGKYL